MEIVVAVGTWALVLATLWLVHGQVSTAKDERKIQLYLELRKEFDSHTLLKAREVFAEQILDGKPHEEMNQAVLTFFEDLGMLFRRKYLDREMVWETFGYFVKMCGALLKIILPKSAPTITGTHFSLKTFSYWLSNFPYTT